MHHGDYVEKNESRQVSGPLLPFSTQSNSLRTVQVIENCSSKSSGWNRTVFIQDFPEMLQNLCTCPD